MLVKSEAEHLRALFAPGDLGVFVLSPHCDDVAFSLAGTVKLLTGAGISVTMITCFSQSDNLTHEAPGDPLRVSALRKAEDVAFQGLLGNRLEVQWLDLLEAPLRGHSREALFSYTALSSEDQALTPCIAREISHRAPSGSCLIFPLGIGNHIDHRIVRDVGLSYALANPEGAFFYEDLPYAAGVGLSFIDSYVQSLCSEWNGVADQFILSYSGMEAFKQEAAVCYPSQISKRWTLAIAAHSNRLVNTHGAERLWHLCASYPRPRRSWESN